MCFNKWRTTVINLFHGILKQKGGGSFWPGFFLTPGTFSLMQPHGSSGCELAFTLVSPHRHLYLFGPGQHWSCVHSCTLGTSYLEKDADYFLNFHFALSLLLRLFSISMCFWSLLPWRLPSLQICSPFLYSDPL